MKNRSLWVLLLWGIWFCLPLSLSGGSIAYADSLSKSKEYFKKGEKFAQEGHYEKAIEAYRKAYELQPSAKLLLLNIAQCYRLANMPEQAKTFYLEYLAADPKSSYREEIEGYLVELDKKLKKKRKLKVSSEDLAASKKYFFQAEEFFAKENYEDAARAYSSAYIFYPSSLLLYNVALSNHLAGNNDLAKDYFERFLARTAGEAEDEKTRQTREKAEEYLALIEKSRTDDILRQMALDVQQNAINTSTVSPRRSRSWMFLALGALSLGAATTFFVSSNSFDRNADFFVTLP